MKKSNSIFFKKPFSSAIFEVLSNLYHLSLFLMAGCIKVEKTEGGEEEKENRKRDTKWGSQAFLSPCPWVSHTQRPLFGFNQVKCIRSRHNYIRY